MAGCIASGLEEVREQQEVIREYVAEDWLAAHAYRGDPEVARYMAPRVAESLEQTRTWLEETLRQSAQPSRREYTFAITLRSDGRLIGQIWIEPSAGDVPAEDELSVGAGGAIVIDSDPADEYEEMLLKAGASLRSVRLPDTGAEAGSGGGE